MADLSVTAPPTGVNPDKTYSDNTWLKLIWYSLTNAGATPGGDLGGNTIVVGNVAAGVADSGAPVKTGGKYNTTAPVLTNGQRGDTQLDAGANTMVTLATKLAGEDLTNDVQKVEQRFNAAYVSTATTVTPKTGAGLLHTVTVQGGTAGTVTIYDNTAASGTVLANFDSTNALATYIFDCAFSTGLTIVTAAATKVSVTYR